LGCTVLCIEQHPVIAALLADGIFRANEGDLWLREIVQRMHLTQGHAETVLSENKADVIYLDPMYPHQQNRKLAKVKKAMQLFRSFPGTDSNEESLLEAACSSAVDRVVVKRPDWAKAMAGSVPTYQVPGKNHRFDVYKTVL
jgi:16S rRNA (guanine1516-N2)-methyltransferase